MKTATIKQATDGYELVVNDAPRLVMERYEDAFEALALNGWSRVDGSAQLGTTEHWNHDGEAPAGRIPSDHAEHVRIDADRQSTMGHLLRAATLALASEQLRMKPTGRAVSRFEATTVLGPGVTLRVAVEVLTLPKKQGSGT